MSLPLIPVIFSTSDVRAIEHEHRQTRNAHEAILFVGNPNFPDVTAATHVNRSRRSDHETFRDGAHMVGVDLLPHDALLRAIDDECGRHAAYGFRQCNGCTAMQDSEGLMRAAIDGHSSAQEVCSDFNEFDAQIILQTGPIDL